MTQSLDSLYRALRKDNLQDFARLLQSCGWPTYSRWSDYHLLCNAIRYGCKNVAKYLLDLGCRVAKSGKRSTLIHEALTYADWTDVVVKLIGLGAPVSCVNDEGDTAVHVAFKNNADGNLVDLLLLTYVQQTRENVKDWDGLSILHIACSRPNLLIVREMTCQEARAILTREDLNGQVQSEYGTGYSGYTPLHFAVKNGRLDIVKFLLHYLNVEIYNVDVNQSTPLHLALELGDVEMMDCLLEHDMVHGDVVNNMGFSHFMAACAATHTSVVADYLRFTRPTISPQILINNRVADDGGSPYRGYTALHFAAEFDRRDTVQLLLANGASCFAMSADNQTPMVVASKRGHEDVCCLLRQKREACKQAMYDVIGKHDREGEDSGYSSSPEKSRRSTPVRSFIQKRMSKSFSPTSFDSRRSSTSSKSRGFIKYASRMFNLLLRRR